MLLNGQGLNVFLDVDNLGQGDFAAQILYRMRRAKNVVLAWTPGCMDRFFAEAPGTVDFVRMEYRHALEMGHRIVPVYKEDFQIPPRDKMPEDVRAVMDNNAIKWVAEYRDASLQRLVGQLQL